MQKETRSEPRSLGPSLDLDDGCTSGLHSVSVSSSVLPFPVPGALVLTSSRLAYTKNKNHHRDNQNSAADLRHGVSLYFLCASVTPTRIDAISPHFL